MGMCVCSYIGQRWDCYLNADFLCWIPNYMVKLENVLFNHCTALHSPTFSAVLSVLVELFTVCSELDLLRDF